MRTRTKKLLAVLLAALIIISAMSACKKDPPVVTPDPVIVTVSFDKQGGTGTANNISATVGEAYGVLPELTKAGYDFGGWFYDAAGTGSAVTAATIVVKEENHTLYAKWTAKAVTVTLDAGAGGTVSPASLTVTYGGTYGGLPTASRYGYTFGGWFVGAGGTGSEVKAETSVTNASAHTLYAKWTAISGIAVTFDLVDESADWLGGSEAAFTGKTVTFGSAYGALPDKNDIELEDNFFGGWYLNLSEGAYSGAVYSSALVATTAAHTLYAKWIDKTEGFEIKFDLNYTSAPSIDSKYVEEHTEYGQLPEPIRTGYNFAGWFTADGVTAVTAATIAGAGQDFTTIYAKWAAKETALIFNANDFTSGNGSTNAAGIHTGATATYNLAMPALSGVPTRTGYTFAGYYDAATSGTIYYSAALASSRAWNKDTEEAVTLYARWTAIGYTISYNVNGGSNSGTFSSTSVNFDASVNLRDNPASGTPRIYRTGYTFMGWNTIQANANAGTVQFGNNAAFNMVESLIPSSGTGITLYAVWKANEYELNINENLNSGTISPTINHISGTIKFTYGAALPDLSSYTVPSRYGYTFNGIFTAAGTNYAGGGTKLYNDDLSAVAAVTSTPELTAVYYGWTASTGTVRYDMSTVTGATTSTSGTGTQWAIPTPGTNWGPVTSPTGFRVSYDSVGGTATSNYTGYGNSASSGNDRFSQRFPTLYKAGYTFNGWWVKDGGGAWAYKLESYSTRVTILGDHTVGIKWLDNSKTVWDFTDANDIIYFSNSTLANLGTADFGKFAIENNTLKLTANKLGWQGVKLDYTAALTAGSRIVVTFSATANVPFWLIASDDWADRNTAYGANGNITTSQITRIFTLPSSPKGVLLAYNTGDMSPAPDLQTFAVYIHKIEVFVPDVNKKSWNFSNPTDMLYFSSSETADFGVIENRKGDGKNWLKAVVGGNNRLIINQSVAVNEMVTFTLDLDGTNRSGTIYPMTNNGAWGADMGASFAFEYNGSTLKVAIVMTGSASSLALWFATCILDGGPNHGAYQEVYVTDITIGPLPAKTNWDFSDPNDVYYFSMNQAGTFSIDTVRANGPWLKLDTGVHQNNFILNAAFTAGCRLKFTIDFDFSQAGMQIKYLFASSRKHDGNFVWWGDYETMFIDAPGAPVTWGGPQTYIVTVPFSTSEGWQINFLMSPESTAYKAYLKDVQILPAYGDANKTSWNFKDDPDDILYFTPSNSDSFGVITNRLGDGKNWLKAVVGGNNRLIINQSVNIGDTLTFTLDLDGTNRSGTIYPMTNNGAWGADMGASFAFEYNGNTLTVTIVMTGSASSFALWFATCILDGGPNHGAYQEVYITDVQIIRAA